MWRQIRGSSPGLSIYRPSGAYPSSLSFEGALRR
jgi:hypothetical protein